MLKLVKSVVKSPWDEEWSHCTVLSYYGMIEIYGGQEAVVQAIWEIILSRDQRTTRGQKW